MKKLTQILLFSLIALNLYGTAQIPDFLIYQGDTLPIYTNPLEAYFENHPRPNSLFYEIGLVSTATHRGYIAYWELQNDSLFLLKLQGKSGNIDLSLIFKDREITNKIFANWYSYSILHPYGRLLHYEHNGYASIYEFEKDFTFEKGMLINTKIYDNSKLQKSEYTTNLKLLKDFLHKSINYENLPESDSLKRCVYVSIHSVNENGKITDVKVIRGVNELYDKEAVRIVKSIPKWDIIYRHGKQEQQVWSIRIDFDLTKKKKKKKSRLP